MKELFKDKSVFLPIYTPAEIDYHVFINGLNNEAETFTSDISLKTDETLQDILETIISRHFKLEFIQELFYNGVLNYGKNKISYTMDFSMAFIKVINDDEELEIYIIIRF